VTSSDLIGQGHFYSSLGVGGWCYFSNSWVRQLSVLAPPSGEPADGQITRLRDLLRGFRLKRRRPKKKRKLKYAKFTQREIHFLKTAILRHFLLKKRFFSLKLENLGFILLK